VALRKWAVVRTPTSCVACGRPADEAHHVTGRPSPDAPYFDPDFVFDLCREHHVSIHVVIRAAGLEWPDGDDIRHRVHRTVAHFRWLADTRRSLSLTPESTRALGSLLIGTVADIQRRNVA
jgi:hypothetical protein